MRLFVFCLSVSLYAQSADLILHHGKIVTVDPQFHIVDAIAIRGDRIIAVGRYAGCGETRRPEYAAGRLEG